MKYSDAFESLHELSLNINLRTEVQYKRVAIFIGRVMMTERAEHNNRIHPQSTMQWMEECKGKKPIMIRHVIGLTDFEWETIKKVMLKYASQSGGSDQWKYTRREFIYALDTMREFERE